MMRQGLCYCHDRSFDCRPPEELNIAGLGENTPYGPSGTYFLEPELRNGRPFYRNGDFLLHWRPDSSDWAVVEDNAAGYVWGNVCKDAGNPALAQATWYAWNGEDFVKDAAVSCDVASACPCPWKRPPHACKCCAGISLGAAGIQSFMGRVAAVLNERNPGTFAFLHGGYYKGVRNEVQEFYAELERAAELFNSRESRIGADVLWREEGQDTEDDPTFYWNKAHGVLLSAKLA